MPKPWERWRASMSVSWNEPGSSSFSSRSLAVSLPPEAERGGGGGARHVGLGNRAGVEQLLEPLPRGQLAPLLLAADGGLAAAKLRLRPAVPDLLDPLVDAGPHGDRSPVRLLE